MDEPGSIALDAATLAGVAALCRAHHVKRLDLFGSALTPRFDAERSDIDLLVAFEALSPGRYADSYFGLLAGLEALFGRPVDLLTEAAMVNPYLRREVDATRSALFPAQ